jgi:hypothetical protein
MNHKKVSVNPLSFTKIHARVLGYESPESIYLYKINLISIIIYIYLFIIILLRFGACKGFVYVLLCSGTT